jgi:hypothetical protein
MCARFHPRMTPAKLALVFETVREIEFRQRFHVSPGALWPGQNHNGTTFVAIDDPSLDNPQHLFDANFNLRHPHQRHAGEEFRLPCNWRSNLC